MSIVKEYFLQGDSKEHKDNRAQIYDIYNKNNDEEAIVNALLEKSEIASKVVSFYDVWAMFVKKHYLPLWTFKGIVGDTAVNMHNKLKPYIEHRRNDMKNYAAQFEWLARKIKSKYGR